MKKAALFFDIDGTLLSEITHKVPESTLRALEMAKENGHEIFVNTGRTMCSIVPEILKIDFNGFLCGCGTYIFYNGEELFHSILDEEKCKYYMELMRECNVSGVAEAFSVMYFSDEQSRFEEMEYIRRAYIESGLNKNKTEEMKKFQYDKFYICSDEKSDLKTFFEKIQPDIYPIDRLKGAYECIQKDYTKATAIEYMRKYLGLTMDQIYIFGDSSNDLTMFQYAEHAIAMKKHNPVLEPYTEYVTDTVENDGIYKAMKHYGLI
ncbi:MAG: Cof-type HAD-IIB family hydrolase [Dorea sp.]